MIPAQRGFSDDDALTEPIPAVFVPAQRREPPDPQLLRRLVVPVGRRGGVTSDVLTVLVGAVLVIGALVLLSVTGGSMRPTPEDAFFTQVAGAQGLVDTLPRESVIAAGRAVCAQPGVAREVLARGAGGGTLGLTIVDAARAHLCP